MCTAITTVNTADAPATMVWAATSAVTTSRSLSFQIERKPADTSVRNFSLGSSSSAASPSAGSVAAGSRAGTLMRMIISIDHTNVSTLSRNTTSTSATTRRRAPMEGPMKNARLSSVLEVPLDAVSSSGRFASDGISARWAGRNAVLAMEVSVASTNTKAGCRSR